MIKAGLVLLFLACFACAADVVIEDFLIDGSLEIAGNALEETVVHYSPNLWTWRELRLTKAYLGWSKAQTFYLVPTGRAHVYGNAEIITGDFRYQFKADPVNYPTRTNPSGFEFANGIDGTAQGNTGIVGEFISLFNPLHVEITIADIFGNSNVAQADFPADGSTIVQAAFNFNQHYPNVDATKIAYITIHLESDYAWDYEGLYFSGVASTCQSSANAASASAAPITVNLAAPTTLTVETCGNCIAADFTGFPTGVQKDNVYWFSIAQQSTALTATFSSSSFAGYNDAYLWVFDAQGNLLASVDNLSADLFEVTLDINEIPVIIAIGAECTISSFTLTASFSAAITDISLQLEELGESLTGLINDGFSGVGTQVNNLSGQLTNAVTDINTAVGQSTTTITGLITTETNEIDAELADLDTDLATVSADLTTHINTKFTDLNTALGTSFGDVNQDLLNIADQITDQCGSSSDGVAALTTYLTAQWTNWRNQQIIEKLVTGALVPAHYQTPAAHGGILEDILAFVTNTFNAKKALADSQKNNTKFIHLQKWS